ncbi:MAG: hypothetical protein Q9214_005056 [Letrouitia sp. 1 TL-2023]
MEGNVGDKMGEKRLFSPSALQILCLVLVPKHRLTWFILPVPKSAAESLVKPLTLITPPFSNRALFPNGFPANSHPVVISTGFQNDIRMINLKIDNLLGASIYIPYTDRLKDGKTPFNFPVQNYIGGVNGNDVQGAVPALVGTAQGTNIFVGAFHPNDNAYAPLASNPNEFVAQVNQVILPNDVSGPGLEPSAFDLDFISTRTPLYTAQTFHTLINQPAILTNTLCQRNTYYFNETFAAPVFRSGNATLYGPLEGSVPAVLKGRYVKQGGYSASAEMLGFNAESCGDAAKNSR